MNILVAVLALVIVAMQVRLYQRASPTDRSAVIITIAIWLTIAAVQLLR